MSRGICGQEEAVSAAVTRGGLPQHLAAHAADCPRCREIVGTARWMQSLAHADGTIPELPDPKLIWWSAQLSGQQARVEKNRRLLGWLEIASGAAVPLGLAGWIAWRWFTIQAEAMKLLIGMTPQFGLAAYSLATLAPALLLLAAMFLAYPLLVRD
jgi:hypothetical protein